VIFHALILGAAGAISGFLLPTAGDPRSGVTNIPSGIVFGAILAGYLWMVLGVRSPAKVGVVSVTAAGAFILGWFAMGFVELIELFTRTHFMPQTSLIMHFVFAGTVTGGLVSMGFLAALPWPRETTRFYAEVLLCAMLEDPFQFSYAPFGAVWQGGMGVVLALIADVRLAKSSADTPSAEHA
jgi:hypothetical protein